MLPGGGSAFQSSPISLPKGTLLNHGRYRIERELNRGGTAVVYAAEDRATNNYVALKVMHGPDQVPLKVVRREITFSSSVSHDNIVRLLDVFAERQQLVIVWELISGPDLLDLLNECGGRMPEDMAAFYFTQALRGLVFMHANGFCHRDIKPENCMVQRANHQLKLIDFGLSKHLASARTLGVGTPDYMSPEMLVHQQQSVYGDASGQPPYDARRVDAWAMGVLMYLLVTGRYPFEDEAHPNNLAATVANVLSGRMRPLPAGVSPGLQGLLAGLLQPRPDRRSTLLDLVDNPWLASAAAAYARRAAAQQPPPPGSGSPEQWIDLREYRQLAHATAGGRAAGGSIVTAGRAGSGGGGPAAPGAAAPGASAAIRHAAAAVGATAGRGVAAPAGPLPGSGSSSDIHGSSNVIVPLMRRSGGLTPAGASEDVTQAAGAMRHVAGVHTTPTGPDVASAIDTATSPQPPSHHHHHHHHQGPGHHHHHHHHQQNGGGQSTDAGYSSSGPDVPSRRSPGGGGGRRSQGGGASDMHRGASDASTSTLEAGDASLRAGRAGSGGGGEVSAAEAAAGGPKGAFAKMRAFLRRKLES